MNTRKSLNEIIDDYFGNAHPNTKANTAAAIVEAVEGLLPDKITIEFSKYHHQTQVNGWNDYRNAVLQAIKEWQNHGE